MTLMLTTKAYAKINLSLEIIGLRQDGYHDVSTIYQTVSLADTIYVDRADIISLTCSQINLSNENNLAYKAANLLQQFAGYVGGAKIEIIKEIPEAMGLGGGSSDAAATLIALNQLWDLNLKSNDLHYLASNLGADVPYLLHGGTTLGTAIGNNLKTLKSLKNKWLVLVCPITTIENKTQRLYKALNYELFSNGDNTMDLADSIAESSLDNRLMINSFEQIAFDVFTGLDIIKDDMLQCGASSVHLSGTGPSLFTFVAEKEHGTKLRDQLSQKCHKAYLLETIDASPILTPDRSRL